MKEWAGDNLGFDWYADPMRDSYFEFPLWLQAPCCGHNLWAYNLRHLNLIEAYIGAGLREQEKDPQWGWSNGSLANRLPEWMIVAKHREAVLKAVAKLKIERMSLTIEEIKSAITQLPQHDLAQLAAWFKEFRTRAWDKQTEDHLR